MTRLGPQLIDAAGVRRGRTLRTGIMSNARSSGTQSWPPIPTAPESGRNHWPIIGQLKSCSSRELTSIILVYPRFSDEMSWRCRCCRRLCCRYSWSTHTTGGGLELWGPLLGASGVESGEFEAGPSNELRRYCFVKQSVTFSGVAIGAIQWGRWKRENHICQ